MSYPLGRCCIENCGDPNCQVCSVNRRFPESAKELQRVFDLQMHIFRMTDQERLEYYASIRTKRGKKPRGPTRRDLRDGKPGMKVGRGTASANRKGPR